MSDSLARELGHLTAAATLGAIAAFVYLRTKPTIPEHKRTAWWVFGAVAVAGLLYSFARP